MKKDGKTMGMSSFNGAVMSLSNLKITDMGCTEGILSVPTVVRMPIYVQRKSLIYVPQEWVTVKTVVKNLILLSFDRDPKLLTKSAVMSVFDNKHLHTHDEIYSGITSGGLIFTERTSPYPKLSRTLIISWVDDYTSAETVNRMISHRNV